jgi:hypothetical protein
LAEAPQATPPYIGWVRFLVALIVPTPNITFDVIVETAPQVVEHSP